MKRALNYIIVTFCLHLLGIVLSSILFLIFFHFRDSAASGVTVSYLYLGFGLGLVFYPFRALFVAIVVSALVRLRNPIVAPVVAFFWAAAVFYFFLRYMISFNRRDQCLFMAGVSGYTVATFLVQRYLSRRFLSTFTKSPDA